MYFCAIAAFASLASNCTFAQNPASAPRFQLNGAGAVTLDAPLQRNAALSLKALLSAKTSVRQLTLLSGDRFALAANLAAAVQVCYGDTIFRDDFDGDGF